MKRWIGAFVLFFPLIGAAEPGQGRWGVGVNTPGLGLRYVATQRTAFELRAQATSDVTMGGARVIRFFRPESRMLPYVALEADYLVFEAEDTRGTGAAGAAVVGLEHFLTGSFALQVDAGPAYSWLNDDAGLRDDGFTFVLGAGLMYYFGRSSR